MYRKVLTLLISLFIIVLIYFGTIVYKDFKAFQTERHESDQIVETVPKEENIKTVETVPQNENDEIVANIDSDYRNPFNQKFTQVNLTDEKYLEYIHKMSHQKVISESKWGFFKMTDERIDWLLESLDQDDVYSRLTDVDIYLDILTRWKNEDFSQVDKDHNTVWRLQGGGTSESLGEATGIADEESERKYIEINIEH